MKKILKYKSSMIKRTLEYNNKSIMYFSNQATMI